MQTLTVQPLTAEAFAPFGDVLEVPTAPGRQYYNGALANLRPTAGASLSLSLRAASPALPLTATLMERHQFSSQSFVPLDAGTSYLVLVAPHHAEGGPDMAQARAFLARGDQGITYRADTWHHGLTVFGQAARFAVFMWQAGDAGDEEFVDIAPLTIAAQEVQA